MKAPQSSTPVFVALAVALGAWFGLIALAQVMPEGGTLARLTHLLGGSSQGFIQAAIYGVATYSFLVLRGQRAALARESGAFAQALLPEQDQLVLTPEEVAAIKLETIRREQTGQASVLGELIKKACTQFRNANNVGETLQVFQAQVATRKEATEGQLEVVRYLTGAIVSLGFIGTLLGLSSSIGLSHLAKTEAGMGQVTQALNLAFDTTLVALVVGLALNFLYHRYLRDVDTFYSRTRAYVIDNLISRIYRPGEVAHVARPHAQRHAPAPRTAAAVPRPHRANGTTALDFT